METHNKKSGARPRLSVLIADDDVDTVLTLAEMLRDEGHIVHTCASARVVVESIQRYKPDICLLDIVMPSKTGFTIAREVLATMKPHERPILIAISGVFTSPSDEVVVKSAGFDHFIRKGTEPTELLRLINSYAGGPSSPAAA
jgi:DNA-binding response OmpR family regulator